MRRPDRALVALAVSILALSSLGADGGACGSSRARAQRIAGDALPLVGPQALGTEGDYLLFNDHAAFVVTGPGERLTTWWTYPGILVDAVALDGCDGASTDIDDCRQAGLERYEEFLPLLFQADLSSIPDDGLGAVRIRGFRGESVEIVNDGSDGRDAIVRVHGSDDRFWLVELTLVNAAFQSGQPIGLSEPLGLDMEVDYILPPDAASLRVVVRYRNTGGEEQRVSPAAAHLFGTTLEPESFQLGGLEIEGFGTAVGIPWITAHSTEDDGAVVFGMENAILSGFAVSGVDALSDARRALLPYRLAPAGSPGDSAEATYHFAVGADAPAAERALQAARPRAFPGTPYTLGSLPGRVLEAGTGAPVAGATVRIEGTSFDESWQTLHRTTTDADGRFELAVADLRRNDLKLRVRAEAEGRSPSEALPFSSSTPPSPTLEVGRRGEVRYTVRDGDERLMPATISLWDGSRRVVEHFGTGTGSFSVEPGSYEVSVTRGFEYRPYQGAVDVVAGTPAALDVALERVVDTSGWMSMDGHLHAAPSPDSRVPIVDRMRGAAAAGLEIPISTDHEYVGSWRSGIDEAGLGDWLTTVVGLELTSTLPEHINLYGLEPRFDIDGRGGIVRWYGLDIDQIFAASRARGAGVITINHPDYLRTVGYDPLTGAPTETDPTGLGWEPDQVLWSWNFDGIELGSEPFGSSGGGSFENWMSFFHHGHPVTALMNTDTHGVSGVGREVNYVATSTDDPAALDPDEVPAAVRAGRSIMGRGAFARVTAGDGAGLGEITSATGGSVDLTIRVEAIPEIDVTHVIVFANCDEVAKIPTTDPDGILKLATTVNVPLASDATLVVAGFGQRRFPRGLESFDPRRRPRFLTNPILADRDGNGSYDAPGGKSCSYDLSPP